MMINLMILKENHNILISPLKLQKRCANVCLGKRERLAL